MRNAARMPRWRAFLLGVCSTVLFVAPVVGQTTRSPGGRTLDSASRTAWAALLRAHDRRSADTVAIDAALASRHAPMRAAAARIIGMNRISARYATLRTMLRTERDTGVASDAAFALGLAADSAGCAPLRLATRRFGVGVAAAWALGELNAACGDFPGLLDSIRAPVVRASLLRVAGKWAAFPDASVAAAYRRATARPERWAALYAFARGRRTAGSAFALAASRDADATIRDLGARLLSATIQPPADASQSVARLTDLLADRAPHVRISAVRSLASYRDVAYAAFVRAWNVERDENVRVTLAQSLGTVAPDTAAAWSAWWQSDSTHMVRRSLIASAWQAGAIAALDRAAGDSLATHPDFRIRLAMIEGAASRSVDEQVRALAVRTLAVRTLDADPRVRAAAISTLFRATEAARTSVAFDVANALGDRDAGVRGAALDGLRRSASASDMTTALAGYERAVGDSSADAREAALDLIAAVWKRDSVAVPDSLRDRLRALVVPDDASLRRRVAGVTPLAAWQRPAPTATPSLDEYERIVRTVLEPTLAGRAPELLIATSHGTVRILLDGVRAPMTSDHLTRLARAGYFRDLRFHRVVPAFVAQGGDPRGDGSGGPGYAIRDELNRSAYRRGAVGMALSGPDTGGSQFFLTLSAQPHLDGHYTVFGAVSAGLETMDTLLQGDSILAITPVSR